MFCRDGLWPLLCGAEKYNTILVFVIPPVASRGQEMLKHPSWFNFLPWALLQRQRAGKVQALR